MNNNLAPIVLFVYNRPWHTKQLLDTLASNAEAKDSILFIYCDGEKDGESIAESLLDLTANYDKYSKIGATNALMLSKYNTEYFYK